jgi:hypothetical protein
MSDGLSESAIVEAAAEKAAKRVTRSVIAVLQKMRDTLSGEDSGLKTTWDEICAQIQFQESVLWDTYDEVVRTIVKNQVDKLPAHEREAIWLQTDAGVDWSCKEPDQREAQPVFDGDIIDWLITEHVYQEASNWSNPRIRAYLERTS